VDNPEQLPTVISFCSGYAGIERGLDLAGVEHRVLAYVEIETFAIANLVAKMEAGELAPAPIWTNLKTFPAHLFRGCVDIITGGYPCQPFSAAGNRKGADDPRHLWPFIRRHTRTIRPARCFFENVEGHISLGLSSVLSDLEEDGYTAPWGIFSAEEVGAPQQRKRVYILGNSTDSGCDRRPVPAQRTRPESISQQSPQNPLTKAAGSGAALADSNGQREQQPQGREQNERGRLGDSSEEQADPHSQRLQGQERCGTAGKERESIGHAAQCGRNERWPARQGQPQHDWEPPRTVWTAKPGLGGGANGSPDRVDRIRLLGSGVVPSTAAKAWQVLDAELTPPIEEQKS
jgi:DNA (cytosine-5)-methyltransferase 1